MSGQTIAMNNASDYQWYIEDILRKEYISNNCVVYCEKHDKPKKFKELLTNYKMINPWSTFKEPDAAIFWPRQQLLDIIEIKFHNQSIEVRGSVDEKFETANFKQHYYNKIAQSNNWSARFRYIANERHNITKTNEILKDLGILITYIGE